MGGFRGSKNRRCGANNLHEQPRTCTAAPWHARPRRPRTSGATGDRLACTTKSKARGQEVEILRDARGWRSKTHLQHLLFAELRFCMILYAHFFTNHRWLLWDLLGIHKKKFCGAMKMMGTFFSQGNMAKEQVLEITQTWRIEKLEMDTWHIHM